MDEEDFLLQVGDVIYQCGNYGIYDRMKIDRVTPKRAYAGSLEFERVYSGDNIEKGKGHKDMGLKWYKPETEKRKAEFERKEKLSFVKSFNRYDKLTDGDLDTVYFILQTTQQ